MTSMTTGVPVIWNFLINGLFWSFFIISSLLLVVGAALLRLITSPFDSNLKILQQYSCFWASLYIWFNPFWSVRILGRKNVGPHKTYVMVSNHQSMADILVLFRTFLHFKWVAKKSLFKLPLLGWNMSLNGYVPIERGDEASRERCFEICRNWLTKGSSVFFFPEGTRSKDGKIQPFKIGAFRLAMESGKDILPMVIRGSRNAIPKHSLRFHGTSQMELEILPPISVKDFDDAKKLADQTFEEIERAYHLSFNGPIPLGR